MKKKLFEKTIIKIIIFIIVGNGLIIQNILYAEKKASWDSKLTFGGSYYVGNVNKLDLRSVGNITRNDSVMEYSVYYKTILGRNQTVKIVGNDTSEVWIDNNKEISGGWKIDYKPYNVISPFVMMEGYKNEAKKIEWRISGLGGVKWIAYRYQKGQYSLSAAAIYQIDKYLVVSGGTHPERNQSARLSIRPKIKQNIAKNINIENVTFLKFTFNQLEDYDIVSTTTLSVNLSKLLGLELTYEIQYENIVPDMNIKKNDQSFVASLTINIGAAAKKAAAR